MITLRPATIEDAPILLEWRNDKATRAASHNTGQISESEHLAWIRRTLNSSKQRLYIALENDFPVGAVRATLVKNDWELSWTVSPDARGRGIGKHMVSLLASDIKEAICAEVKVGNWAAARIAEHTGMELIEERDGIRYYRRPANAE